MANKDSFEEQISLLFDPIKDDSFQPLDIFKVTADDDFDAKLQEFRLVLRHRILVKL